jgi:hypothetical protein
MMEAVPQRLFSSTIRFYEGGREVAILERPLVGRRPRIRVGDREYRIRRAGWLGLGYVLEDDKRTVAAAEHAGFLPSRYEVMAGDRHLVMKPLGLFQAGFQLRHGDVTIGTIRRGGLFSRHAMIDLPASLPLVVRVFLAFLAYAYWRRRAAAAASG